MNLGNLNVRIGATITDFQKKMGQVHSALERQSKSMEKIGKSMSKFVTLPLLAIGVASIKAASDVEEMRSKFETVFGSLAGDAEKWADDTGKAVNRSKFDLMGYLSTLQDTFVPMGFARDEASKFSKELTQLGVDLASFNNASEPETINLLTSAIVGNHEAVRRFGIVMTEATLKQELLNMGIKGGAQAATEQEKILARMNIIMRSTKDAQGDAARTAESFANQLKGLQAAAKDAAVMIGEQLLPMVTKLVQGVRAAIGHFAAMDEDMKRLTVTVGGLATAFAPLLLALTWIVKNGATLSKVFRGMTAAGAISLLGKGSRIDTGELDRMTSGDTYLDRILGKPGAIKEATSTLRAGVGLAGGEMSRIGQAIRSVIAKLEAAGDAASKKLAGGLGNAAEAAREAAEKLKEFRKERQDVLGSELRGLQDPLTLGMISGDDPSENEFLAGLTRISTKIRDFSASTHTEMRALKDNLEALKIGEILEHSFVNIGIGAVDGLAFAIGDAVAGFESFGKAVKRIMKGVIADIIAAIAKVLILKSLMTIFGGGTGIIGSIVKSIAGAGGVTTGFNKMASVGMTNQRPVIIVQPQLVGKLAVTAGELQFMLDERQSFLIK